MRKQCLRQSRQQNFVKKSGIIGMVVLAQDAVRQNKNKEKSMKRVGLILIAAIACAVPLFTVAGSATAEVHRTNVPQASAGSTLLSSFTFDLQNDDSGLYMRDPSDGGTGTTVESSAFTTSNSEDWFNQVSATCGGTVTSTCPGGWISANLRGDQINSLKNTGQGSLCLAARAGDNWVAKMRSCGDTSAQFVERASVCGSTQDTELFSVDWNNSHSDGGFVIGNPTLNSSVVVGDSVIHCVQSLWSFQGS
jgi:hypothetical protein